MASSNFENERQINSKGFSVFVCKVIRTSLYWNPIIRFFRCFETLFCWQQISTLFILMSDNLPERVQILYHAHIICITVLEHRIFSCQIFCDLLLKSAFERILNIMQVILIKIKWHIKWKYLIQKFHDICLSYYFKWHGA
jgi:hypothetical protein